RVPAEDREAVRQAPVAADRLLRLGRVGVRHQRLGLAHLLAQLVQAARGQDAVEREGVQVPGPRVLREVADGAGVPDGPGGGRRGTGQDLGEGGLAGAVTAHEADAVSLGDLEGRVRQQEPGTSTQLNATGDDHDYQEYRI